MSVGRVADGFASDQTSWRAALCTAKDSSPPLDHLRGEPFPNKEEADGFLRLFRRRVVSPRLLYRLSKRAVIGARERAAPRELNHRTSREGSEMRAMQLLSSALAGAVVVACMAQADAQVLVGGNDTKVSRRQGSAARTRKRHNLHH